MSPTSLLRTLTVGLCLSAVMPWAAAQPAPRITVSTNNTPQDRMTLQVVGQKAFQRLGLELELVSLPSQRSLVAADTGEVDGEGLRIAGLDEQYPNLIRVPEKIITTHFVAFRRNAEISLDRGFDSLRPYRVAHVTGWKLFETQAGVARTVHKVDRPEQMFQMLAADRVDLALYTLVDGQRLVRSLGLAGISPVSPALREADMYLYLNKRHAALVPKLAQALRDMKADGSFQRLAATATPIDP